MSGKELPALFLTAVSGFSTAIGGLIVILRPKPNFVILGHVLSFSSGVMIYISFMDLLPESIRAIGFLPANIYFFLGMIFFELIVRLVPEPEFKHSHTPNTEEEKKKLAEEKKASDNGKPDEQKRNSELLMVGIITALGISLHNFPEGIAVYLSCMKGIHVGLPLALAIAAHNIPEGMAVAAPIYNSTKSKWQAFKWSFISGACEPIGALILGYCFTQYFTDYIVQSVLAGVAGIMVYLSIKELMPATLQYIKPGPATISNGIGMFFYIFKCLLLTLLAWISWTYS